MLVTVAVAVVVAAAVAVPVLRTDAQWPITTVLYVGWVGGCNLYLRPFCIVLGMVGLAGDSSVGSS